MCRTGRLFSVENRKGLVVLAATTWLNMLVYAPLTVFAILFVALENEFKASATATGEIGSVAWAVFNLSTPLPTFLIQKWGPRIVTVTGILMIGGGLFPCTFSNEIWMLVLFYGVVQGLGLCFIQAVTTQLLTSFFKGSALVRALSFAAIGETVGMFALSPVFTLGVTKLGWRLVCQIASVVIITICLPTCYVLDGTTHAHLLQGADEIQKDCAIEEKTEPEVLRKGEIRPVRKKHLALAMRIPGIWVFSMATVLYVLCMGFVMISLVEILVVQGQSMTDSAWFVTIFAVSQTTGKVLNIIIGNRLCISNMKILVLMCITGGMLSLGMVYFESVIAYIFAYSIGLSYDLTGSYRYAHIAIVVFWFLAALLLTPLALGWPSVLFSPYYCCHRDYTKVQQSTTDTLVNSAGTTAAPCSTNSEGELGKHPCSVHDEHESCAPHISSHSDVTDEKIHEKDKNGQVSQIPKLKESTC